MAVYFPVGVKADGSANLVLSGQEKREYYKSIFGNGHFLNRRRAEIAGRKPRQTVEGSEAFRPNRKDGVAATRSRHAARFRPLAAPAAVSIYLSLLLLMDRSVNLISLGDVSDVEARLASLDLAAEDFPKPTFCVLRICSPLRRHDASPVTDTSKYRVVARWSKMMLGYNAPSLA